MLSKSAKEILIVCMANRKLGSEVAARLIDATPANAAAAQAVLSGLAKSENKRVEEYLIVALANRKAGQELSKKINGMVAVLEAKADGLEVLATAGSFSGTVAGLTTPVVITANTAGAAGNITLTATGATVTARIAAWNAANPSNQVTLTSGDGAQIHTASIVLSGGTDASDANLAPAKAAMGSDKMSDSTFEILVIAMASRKAAEDFKSAFNAMIDAVQAIA
jgi:hypothetical protein